MGGGVLDERRDLLFGSRGGRRVFDDELNLMLRMYKMERWMLLGRGGDGFNIKCLGSMNLHKAETFEEHWTFFLIRD